MKNVHKKFINISLLILMVLFQLFGIASIATHRVKAAVSEPNGPIKQVIVTYKNTTGIQANTIEEKQDLVYFQKNKLMTEQIKTEGYKQIVRNLKNIPVSIMNVDSEGEASLKASDKVQSVVDNKFITPSLKDTIPFIGGSVTTGFSDGSTDFTGNSQAVAIIDEGFNTTHPMLNGAVTSEICLGQPYEDYINATIESACPGGVSESNSSGSAGPNTPAYNHGTSVASAAVGRTVTAGPNTYSGVAMDADILAIKVVAKITEKVGYDLCGDGLPTVSTCYRLSMSLVLTALDKVIDASVNNSLGKPIASTNLSLGNTSNYYNSEANCNAANAGFAEAFASLKLLNIAAVASAGNDGDGVNQDKILSPACNTNAIAVSSSTRSDAMAYYSNAGSLTDLVAPGGDMSFSGDGGIILAGDGSSMSAMQGTSFAAPLVTGAYAVIREKNPTVSVDTILRILQESGTNVTENRAGYSVVTHKRLALASALTASLDLPSITSVTAQGDNFEAGSNVDLAITTINAVSCTQIGGSGTANLTDGEGTMGITVTGGTQTYTIECVDTNGYASRYSIVLAASGNSGVPGSANVGSDGEVLGANTLGTPNTGMQRFLRQNVLLTLLITVLASGCIIYIVMRRNGKFSAK